MSKLTMGQRMARFWDTTRTRYSHLGDDISEVNFLKARFKTICEGLNLDQKIIIDYGCGGALLGEYLFENKNICKYIGYDVSSRSVKKAKDRLKNVNAEINQVIHHDIDFSKDYPDIIFCIACLYHFPAKEYLERYLKRFNESTAKTIILEIRYNPETVFNQNPYSDMNSITMACQTNPEFISEKLTNYRLSKKSEINNNKLQLLWYKLKTKKVIE